MDFKVGDLVYCPVNLDTGEMFGIDKELAIVVTIYKSKSIIEVIYIGDDRCSKVLGSWYINEVELISVG